MPKRNINTLRRIVPQLSQSVYVSFRPNTVAHFNIPPRNTHRPLSTCGLDNEMSVFYPRRCFASGLSFSANAS